MFIRLHASLLHGLFSSRGRGQELLSRCNAQTSHCGYSPCCGPQALSRLTASVVTARGLSSCGSRALERRLSSYGTWASWLCSRWHFSGSGIKPVSPGLAGGFITTEPPGTPRAFSLEASSPHPTSHPQEVCRLQSVLPRKPTPTSQHARAVFAPFNPLL